MDGNELIARHEKMVLGLACRLRRELGLRGELDDLIAFGFGGLLEAQHRFDPTRGIRFQTFAYHRIRGAMLDGVRKMALFPRRAHERFKAAEEQRPTAAPTELDKAFKRMSASLTGAAPLQGRYGEQSPEAELLRSEALTRLLGGDSRPFAEAKTARAWTLLRRALPRCDGAGARYLEIVGKPTPHTSAPAAAGCGRAEMSPNRPAGRFHGIVAGLRAYRASRLGPNCEPGYALVRGCAIFGVTCGKSGGLLSIPL